jgi:hypothetical protein
MLWSPQDSGYLKRRPQAAVELSSAAKLQVSNKYSQPVTWEEFTLLYNRLMVEYAVHYHEQLRDLSTYYTKLLNRYTLGLSSVASIIAYDHRHRMAHSGTWEWITFDQEAFVLAQQEFPIPTPHTPGKGNNAGSPSKSSKSPLKAVKFTVAEQKIKGICTAWAQGNTCQYESRAVGCFFYHGCNKAACAQDDQHKPSACPN